MRVEDKEIIATKRAPVNELTDEDYEYDENGELIKKKWVSELVRNPNGANQHFPDARAELCWKLYIQGLIKGQPNAKAAALKAGYGEKFAANVVNTKWWKEHKDKLRRKNMLTRAEINLSKLMRMDYSKVKLLEDGSEVEEIDMDRAKLVGDISKYVTTTLGKEEYSTKTIEDKNVSHDIKIESVSYADPIEIPIQAQTVIKEAVIKEITDGE